MTILVDLAGRMDDLEAAMAWLQSAQDTMEEGHRELQRQLDQLAELTGTLDARVNSLRGARMKVDVTYPDDGDVSDHLKRLT